MNTGLHISLQIKFFISLGKYAEMELLDHVKVQFFILWGSLVLFSLVAALIYILIKSAQDLSFPTTSWTLVIFLFLMIVILRDVRWYLIVIFICIPLMMASGAEHFFMGLMSIRMSSLGKNIYPDLLPSFLSGYLCLFMSYCVVWILCIFRILTPYQIFSLEISSPIL